MPEVEDLPERLAGVLAVLFLVFNEGYWVNSGAGSGEAPVRRELTDEAIRLARVLRALLPDEAEVAGLLALLLLTDARRAARFASGELVPLRDQDRAGWDRSLVAEGHGLVRECLARERATGLGPGRYQLLAAINAVHTDAPTPATPTGARSPLSTTNWYGSTGHPSSGSTARSRSPSSTARPWRWPRSTGWTWRATTPGTRRALTCCVGSAGARRRGRRTPRRSRTPATQPSGCGWRGAGTRW